MRLVASLVVLAFAAVSGFAAESDALGISASIQARHLPFGTIVDPIYAAPGSNQIIGYTRCGDSALWTGHYLAAESFRYNVTRAPEALRNVRQAVAGIQSLVDVTGTNLLARCAVPASSPFAAGIRSEEAANGIYTNTATNQIWVGHTSRDQYSGIMFGLATAFDMVDDAGVRSSAADLVTRIVDFLSGHSWNIVMPDGSISTTFIVRADQILSFLQVARHLNPDHFASVYDREKLAFGTAAVSLPVALEVTDDNSYFKFNLDTINLYDLIRLDTAPSIFKGAYDILRNHTRSHQNAFFDIVDRGLNGPDAARDRETVALLDQWLERPRRDAFIDLHGTVPVCGDQACRPVPVPLRPPTDFLWQRNPFQLAGGGSGVVESAGIDYLLPYWMARYYGVLAGFSVQSAAADTGAVAPDSIASIFGSGLAAGTVQAGSATLPTSLGGVGVTVHDSVGRDWPAPLYFVSPVQINFVIPAGVAAGAAQVLISTPAATQPLTASATVQTVAPSLFSVNGNGTGVAAAVAIRVQAGNPKLQAPVPVFQCERAGCAAVPIDVGLDAPVFLSFYGTGIRNASLLQDVKVTINGVSVQVLYAGPQTQFPGLDQVNVPLPISLRGTGEANVVITAAGQVSNTVTVNIR